MLELILMAFNAATNPDVNAVYTEKTTAVVRNFRDSMIADLGGKVPTHLVAKKAAVSTAASPSLHSNPGFVSTNGPVEFAVEENDPAAHEAAVVSDLLVSAEEFDCDAVNKLSFYKCVETDGNVVVTAR